MASKKTANPEARTPEKEDLTAEVNALTSDELLKQSEDQRLEIERLKKELEEAKKSAKAGSEGYRQTDKQRVQEAIRKAIAEGKSMWDVKVPVRARPRTGTTEKHYWLGVNGRFVALPADDKYHELSLPWAECLINAIDAETFAREEADKIQVYDLISNPHEEEREM